MRKYQQLLLLIIAGVSVCALLIYKTENKRLKEILHVINFFGRDDAASLRCSAAQPTINDTAFDVRRDYSYPLGVWQVIGNGFYAYSAYWQSNELTAGGVAIALVVSRPEAAVNFICSFNYGKKIRVANGKFRYQRLNTLQYSKNAQFISHLFYCHISKYSHQPESITFHSPNPYNKSYESQQYTIKLRSLKVTNSASLLRKDVQPAVICLNLQSAISNEVSTDSEHYDMYYFFVHHYILGIKDFIVYNGDELSLKFLQSLKHLDIMLYLMPFNFPFVASNSSNEIRNLIQLDCLLRNDNRADISLLLASNEYFYSATAPNELSMKLNSLSRTHQNQTQGFELTVFNVCKGHKHRLLVQNEYYDSQATLKYKNILYKVNEMTKILPKLKSHQDLTELSVRLPSLPLTLSEAFIHRYIDCNRTNKEYLRKWRPLLDDNFNLQLRKLNDELMIYI